ncbi:unnamed protein product [Ceutorhynchus assimilis]|uniref:Plexin domain-containing protein 2 n=1 Tax=Ceutorhynchus assimilis TaxID=467358 RepID=A0A9P0DM86_9CUCU|nr:unnamed protein product [Ceutorhynchus assimilis]
MAKDRYHYLRVSTICMCLCYLIVFIGYCSAANDNALFYYDTDSSHTRIEHSIHIELEENSHNPRKRDVEVESPLTVTSSTTAAVAVVQNNKSEKVVPWKSQPKLTPPINLSNKQYSILGANGTGQRRNISLPKEPPSLTHNIGPSVNTPVKSITETTVSHEDEATIYPGKLTPEEVEVGDGINEKDLDENNITDFKTDNHIFYNSTTYNDPNIGKQLWVDLEKRSDVKINDLLSASHRRAATVKLSFEFPFYGRFIKNVTIATGGFLYTGNYVHSWLAATQYIAPLMANFDTGLSNDSFVKYVDNGTAFTVEWQRVALQDKPSQEFTFQTTLHKNGNIVFVYKNIPFAIENINDQLHPVKVGLSDAYILDRTVFYVRRKTIYEYHRVTFNKEEIKNWTSIYLTALPTCLDLLNCTSCTYNKLNMNCTWCPSSNQCSTGQDRNRQFWIDKGCELRNITSEPSCFDDEKLSDSLNYEVQEASKLMDDDYIGRVPRQTNNRLGTSGYLAVIFLIAMVVGISLWGAYAYKNPHTTSGQILIRYRPSQWRWRRGEARYTAATIHM